MGGTYGTPAAATLIDAFMVRPENRVLLGTGGTSDLETTSELYSTYGANIGLGAGKGQELGRLTALSFRDVPTVEAVPSTNYQEDTAFEVTGEECEVTLTVREFKIGTLQAALITGRMYSLGEVNEALATFGGGCEVTHMPLVIEFTNAACAAPSTQNIGEGVSGGILTLYKCLCTSGLDWAAITANETSELTLTFRAVADTSKAKRNRLGNLYLY